MRVPICHYLQVPSCHCLQVPICHCRLAVALGLRTISLLSKQANSLASVSPTPSLPGGMCGAMENCTGSTAQIVLGTVNDFAASQAREIPRVIVPIPPPSAPTPSERNGTNNWPHVPRAQTHTDSGLYDRVWSGSIPKSRESWSRIYNAGPPD